MSSFEKTAGKNLDEILASIRKTLADESVDPQTSRKEPLRLSNQARALRPIETGVRRNPTKLMMILRICLRAV